MMSNQPLPRRQRLPIHVLRMANDTGPLAVARAIPCPDHAETVPLATCEHCERLESVTLGERSFVTCRPHKPPHEGRADLSKRLLPVIADDTPLSAIMTTDVVCVARDLGIEALMAIFLDRHIGAVPVIDPDRFPIGIVSKTDLVRHGYQTNDGRSARVRDVMTPIAYTLQKDEPLSSAATLMSVEGVHHVPIVGDDGRLAGMLSSLDLACWISGHHGHDEPAPRTRVLVVDPDASSRAALGELLHEEGYEVRTTATTLAAMRALRDGAADLVLADRELIGSDAAALESAARRSHRAAGFVWMTNRGTRRDGGCDLSKPIDMPSLLARLRELLVQQG